MLPEHSAAGQDYQKLAQYCPAHIHLPVCLFILSPDYLNTTETFNQNIVCRLKNLQKCCNVLFESCNTCLSQELYFCLLSKQNLRYLKWQFSAYHKILSDIIAGNYMVDYQDLEVVLFLNRSVYFIPGSRFVTD